ncbi:Wadjet anti-phage system protein JetD domain-containing protein [Streptomyces qinglanensis]|uniref:Wadjet anti-phage system protein JetD domain-containing protein n=1 Tax=Streptomyces qinglanensis TaxID=943816 RepID=UPI003D752DF2
MRAPAPALDTVIADAAACRPWPGLPAGGLHRLGLIDSPAVGVLLVENEGAFARVRRPSCVTDQWPCVRGAGYATHGLAAFLKAMAPLPVAAWQDLDAHGTQIITNLTERAERAERAGRPLARRPRRPRTITCRWSRICHNGRC